ncbi:MAG: aminopeptidase N [Gammaproteobacteria bacterium]|nr:aminopeptidase N [Gammaproteobacteria bacterium]
MSTAPSTIYLADYQPPAYLIDHVDLDVHLDDDITTVTARSRIRRNPALERDESPPLHLDGQDMELVSLVLDGERVHIDNYRLGEESLLIHEVPDDFELEVVTRIRPQDNTNLEGLYRSNDLYCTQCEAEGFRKITYYPDRPDVMARFRTRIEADGSRFPVLLSNGNKVEHGPLDGGRHFATWEDPFPKPCYLFALVAGRLESIDDTFVTASGREIQLRIFVETKDLDKCDHAMCSLKNAMRWDEEVYGREYDLDIFMIVAVDAFNMGAMENKGLNIFNTSCVLANPATTTDAAFQRVEGVVAHEYFHNWSGNRVTCRDWFQLSLKEGFTVFRDSEFSADMGSRTVKRIEDVTLLRTAQFAEDAGPMAHPVRPDSYMEISNFYTLTVYEKGAEVVRMISQILGAEKFRQGTDLYFERHDGQAVTTEDFVLAMEDASGVDLSQFRNWYIQAGTPVLTVTSRYDAAENRFFLTVKQSCPATPGQEEKKPFHIPLRMGLLNSRGEEIPLRLEGDAAGPAALDRVIHVTRSEETFCFEGVEEEPVPSLLREFSAPVRLRYDYSLEHLYFLMVHDSDGFNRWNASQQLAVRIIQELVAGAAELTSDNFPQILERAFSGILEATLADPMLDKAMVAQLLSLPSESYLIELAQPAQVDAIHQVREFLCDSLAARLEQQFQQVYNANQESGDFSVEAEAVARRSLKNLALGYLMRTGKPSAIEACQRQFREASNMTDQHAGLRFLVHSSHTDARLRTEALQQFYQQWSHEPLVMDQWFTIQATSPAADNLATVEALLSHEKFNIRNPNKVRSVIGAFCGANHVNFHRSDGSGYRFLADQVLILDKLNPQIASRLLTPLTRWKKFDSARQEQMKEQLQRIKARSDLSRDVFEVVEKSTA